MSLKGELRTVKSAQLIRMASCADECYVKNIPLNKGQGAMIMAHHKTKEKVSAFWEFITVFLFLSVFSRSLSVQRILMSVLPVPTPPSNPPSTRLDGEIESGWPKGRISRTLRFGFRKR